MIVTLRRSGSDSIDDSWDIEVSDRDPDPVRHALTELRRYLIRYGPLPELDIVDMRPGYFRNDL